MWPRFLRTKPVSWSWHNCPYILSIFHFQAKLKKKKKLPCNKQPLPKSLRLVHPWWDAGKRQSENRKALETAPFTEAPWPPLTASLHLHNRESAAPLRLCAGRSRDQTVGTQQSWVLQCPLRRYTLSLNLVMVRRSLDWGPWDRTAPGSAGLESGTDVSPQSFLTADGTRHFS